MPTLGYKATEDLIIRQLPHHIKGVHPHQSSGHSTSTILDQPKRPALPLEHRKTSGQLSLPLLQECPFGIQSNLNVSQQQRQDNARPIEGYLLLQGMPFGMNNVGVTYW